MEGSCKQLTRGGPPVWGLGKRIKTLLKRNSMLQNVMQIMDLNVPSGTTHATENVII
jgi:hypothetical protein